MTYALVALILLGSFFLPWWWMIISGVIYAFRFGNVFSKSKILVSSFLSGFMVWGVFCYYFNGRSGGLIAIKVSETLGLGNAWTLMILTAFFGGILVVAGSLLGDELRRYRKRKISLQKLDSMLHNASKQ